MRRVQIEVNSSYEKESSGEDYVTLTFYDDGNVTLEGVSVEGTTFSVQWDRLEAQTIAREILAG